MCIILARTFIPVYLSALIVILCRVSIYYSVKPEFAPTSSGGCVSHRSLRSAGEHVLWRLLQETQPPDEVGVNLVFAEHISKNHLGLVVQYYTRTTKYNQISTEYYRKRLVLQRLQYYSGATTLRSDE